MSKDSNFPIWGKTYRVKDFENLLKNSKNEDPVLKDPIFPILDLWFGNDKEIEVLTSGSSGKPKSIRFSREQMTESAKTSISYFKMKPGEKILNCIPISRIGGMMQVIRALYGDLGLIFIPPSEHPSREIINLGEKISFDHVSIVPNQVKDIIENSDLFQQTKSILIGGASIQQGIETEIINSGLPFYMSFGMTEMASHFAINKPGEDEPNAYQVLPGAEIDSDQNSNLKVRSSVTKNQWIETNDEVEILNPKKFKWLGRSDNVINSAGIKIHPEELELTINELCSQYLADERLLISSVPDDKYGEKIVLLIEGFDLNRKIHERLLNTLKSKLSGILIPTKIIGFNEFPQTSAGKIDRKEIRRMLRLSSKP